MNERTKQFLFWSPRVLTIIFALFISMFALDVFGETHGFWTTLLALLIHLIPTAFIVIVLIFAWKWEWVGGVAFIALSILYMFWTWDRFPVSVYFVICGPMVVISILFFIGWKNKEGIQPK
jgi:hypothetical protein